MHRLPDSSFKSVQPVGYPSTEGIKQMSPQFFQGEDIQMSFYLTDESGSPVTPEIYIIEAIVKKSTAAETILWKGVLGNGLFRKDRGVPGFYYILLPNDASSNFLPGTYYLDIVLLEKLGKGPGIKDITKVALSATFNIELSAASPNPKLKPHSVVEVSYEPETGLTTYEITSVEPTLPQGVDIARK